MLTLDRLARMAARMAREGDDAPFRRPDPALRTRQVTLPSVREEARAALGIFAFVCLTGIGVLTAAGLLAVHGADLVAGRALEASALASTALLFAATTGAVLAALAAIGLGLELRRFGRARAQLGSTALLTSHGTLRSEDSRVEVPLRR